MFCLLANMLAFYFSFFWYKIDRFSSGLVSITLILTAIFISFYLLMKYYIIAGEASGDLYGANLIKEIKKLDKN